MTPQRTMQQNKPSLPKKKAKCKLKNDQWQQRYGFSYYNIKKEKKNYILDIGCSKHKYHNVS